MNSNNNKKQKLGKKLKEPSLLLRIEQIKYRKPGPGKSPLGTIFIFEDRIEWTNDSDKADQLLVNFSKIKAQRISPPNKAKVQLQLCLLNDDQATFVFMNPAHSQEELVQERDLMKETLQQALVQHRQIVNQLAQKAARGGTDKEQEEKIRILEQNTYLHDLYLHLVKEKLITAQDFWSFHYKPDEKLDKNKEKEEDSNGRQRVGISAGFLSSIVQSEGIGGGIRLNLTNETIQSIFRTYPAVERKHLELVPHEMTEQDFWSRFFQSHYFHRERNPAEPSTSAQSQQNDPFADCVQMDEKDMRGIIEKSQRTLKRHLDLTYINEDLGILSEMRSAQISVRGSSEAKKLLVRRCNYHSERVLSTMELEENYNKNEVAINSSANGSTENAIENGSSSKNGKSLHETKSNERVLLFDLDLESQELAEIDGTGQEYTPFSTYNPPTISGQERSAEQIQRAKNALEEALAASGSVLEEKSQIDFFNNLATNSLDSEESDGGTEENGLNSATRFEGLARIDVERIRTVHSCLAELLRHFWHCFPPNSPEMENKIHRMDETLTKFEQNQLAECEQKYGFNIAAKCWHWPDNDIKHSIKPPNKGVDPFPKNDLNMKSSILKTAEQLVEGWRLLKWPRSTGGGAKSYALIGTLADMERALLDYALDFIVARLQGEIKSGGIKGLELVEVDDILPVETTRACGLQQGVSAHPIQYRVFNSHRVFGQDEQNAGTVQLDFNPDSERAFCLSGTAEMGIAHRIKLNIFDECQLPAYFLAESNCFRPEVTRGTKEGGLYRVHEFKKIEMFVVSTERQSERELERIVGIQKDLFDSLQLQCRILDMPEEELGPAATRKFDIEAWMPGRKVWGELSSASNCTDYQARRLQIRYRPSSPSHSPPLPLHFAHTCNGTGLASSRSLIALLETHQKEQNRVDLPAVIKERMPKERSAAFKCGSALPIKYNFD